MTSLSEPTATAEVAPLAPLETAEVRDEKGRFLAGHSVGGRPPGSRNKLTEDFLADFHACWLAHGKAALAKVAVDEPVQFVKAAVQLMPRDVLLEARGAGLIVVKMSDEDMVL
jgi:hypothetical protein